MGLISLLFPPHCPFCGQAVRKTEALCGMCAPKYPGDPHIRLLRTDNDENRFPCWAFDRYMHIKPAIERFKFRGHPDAARGFARLLAEGVLPAAFSAECVTFVPMDAAQKRARGYNQSEQLARELAALLKIPCLPLLTKTRRTKVQHTLPAAARRENLRGAFVAKPQAAGKTILLCDDIVTTGATLENCAAALRAAGAAKIFGIVLADA